MEAGRLLSCEQLLGTLWLSCGACALPVVCSGVSLTAFLCGSSGPLLQEETGTVLLSASGGENVDVVSFRWGSCSAAAQDDEYTGRANDTSTSTTHPLDLCTA